MIILVGHSYGRLVATEAAQLMSQLIKRVVLLEPTARNQRKEFNAIDRERIANSEQTIHVRSKSVSPITT